MGVGSHVHFRRGGEVLWSARLAEAAVFSVLTVACGSFLGAQELPAGSSARLVLGETRAAIELSGVLPTLDDFYTGPSSEQARHRSDWEASWEVGPSRGRDLRGALYDALDLKSLHAEPGQLDEAMARLRTTAAQIEAFEDDLPLHLSLSFRESRGFLSQAESAAKSDQWAESALFILKSADGLREVTPRAVALALIETAEAVLAAESAPEGVTEENRARARRLVLWARSASRSGDHLRAVERAFYACRLAGVILP